MPNPTLNYIPNPTKEDWFREQQLQSNYIPNPTKEDQLEKIAEIAETLERIEKRLNQITGPTLTNGIWR